MTTVCQRWRDQRGTYRPAGETIIPSEYEVARIEMSEAKAFVTQHHYSQSYPACRFRFGLFRRGQLCGVAVFSMPMQAKVLTSTFPGTIMDSIELGRFVLLDHVPANGESWFFARCRQQLRREGIIGVIAFSDDQPRTGAHGQRVFPGHIGNIYQASNAAYLGRGTARTLRLLPDGTVMSDRAIQKIRQRECGWEYAVRILIRHGADEPHNTRETGLRAWLAQWLPSVTRTLKHPGNHRYAWSLDRSISLTSGSYPKRLTPAFYGA